MLDLWPSRRFRDVAEEAQLRQAVGSGDGSSTDASCEISGGDGTDSVALGQADEAVVEAVAELQASLAQEHSCLMQVRRIGNRWSFCCLQSCPGGETSL